MPEIWLVLLVGAVAGTLNAMGGGGTFVALPALVAAGLSPVTANASSTIALVPGAVVGAWVYRRELGPVRRTFGDQAGASGAVRRKAEDRPRTGRTWMTPTTRQGAVPGVPDPRRSAGQGLAPVGGTSTSAMTAISVIGGALGAGLLLVLPSESFGAAVPWLLAFATLLLAFGRPVSRALSTVRAGSGGTGRSVTLGPRTVLIAHFPIAVYGGYFGGAVGIVMLAFWSIGLGLDTAAGNPMRIAQLAALNLSASVLFLVASDALRTPLVLVAMLVGAVAGGFAGAHLARRLPARPLRGIILTIAVTMTVLYFLRG
ncbi:sulfite exporter TauE/SafE family protein [Streptomyces sp. NBC_01506]|uniref:sulfite exporter TauE/SafE family protein n=1 Tax=Streptomyces sp. NBC_01506 TaxID=2903887 RepID=UPI003865E24A